MSVTITASVAVPNKLEEIMEVKWSLGDGKMHESAITFGDIGGAIQDYLVGYATTHLMNGSACHGAVIKYSTVPTAAELHKAGIMVWELDFDESRPWTPDGPFGDPAHAFTTAEYNRRYDHASETAISIITAAGYFQPEELDDCNKEVQHDLQTFLMAAMMRSDKVSRTLFAAINDHIRLLAAGRYALPTGEDDDPVLVCACGEVFDQIWTARDHFHGPDQVEDEAAEFEFRISTRGEAI